MRQSFDMDGRQRANAVQLSYLATGIVFAFLGAIVMGVF